MTGILGPDDYKGKNRCVWSHLKTGIPRCRRYQLNVAIRSVIITVGRYSTDVPAVSTHT